MPTNDEPDVPCLAAQRQQRAMELCRDLYEGTFQLRDKKKLTQFPLEDEGSYARRLGQSILHNAFARTVEGLTGMVMRTPPELGDDVPVEIRGTDELGTGGYWEDIDNAGTHGDVFLTDRLVDALIDGHCGIFVDAPVKDPNVATVADVREKHIRPYWVPIKKADMLRWASERIGSRQVLTYFAFKECRVVKDGKYGEKETKVVREYVRGPNGVQWVTHTLVEGAEGKREWKTETGAAMSITEIPLAVVYAKKVGLLESKPPMEDLAHENLGHFELRSDFRNTLHIAGVPIPYIFGVAEEKIKVGPSLALTGPETAKCGYMEPTGAALSTTRQELIDSETRMAIQGLAFIQADKPVEQTATAKRLEKSEQDSALLRVARSLQDAAENALGYTAMWLGKKREEGGSCSVNTSFEALVLDATQVAEYRNLVAEKRLTVETLWKVLVAGGWLPDSFDADIEKDLIDQERAKNPPPPMGGGFRFVRPQPPIDQGGTAQPKPDDADPNMRK